MDHIQNSRFSVAREQPGELLNSTTAFQNQTGKVAGERVQFVPASQSLADSAEELTFMFSERVGRSLAKRGVSDGGNRVGQLEELVQKYLHKVSDLEHTQKLKDLVANLGKGQLSNVAQLQTYLDGFSKEISHQFMALSFARSQLAGKPDAKALLVLVDQALAVMAQEHGESIELGIVVSPLAAEVASHPGEIQPIRETCRDAIRDCGGLAEALKDIQARFGNGTVALQKAIDFLMKMLAAEYLNIYLDQVKRTLIVRYMRQLQILKKLREDTEAMWSTLITQERIYGVRAF